MRVVDTELSGLKIIEPRVFKDSRGFFLESFNEEVFLSNGLPAKFIQDNHAYSKGKGVIRGFHFQKPPYSQAKLVWVTRGAVMDVVVDLRKKSATYLKTFTIKLSANNFRRLFIPAGFAHGYETLTEESEFLYKVDKPYKPESEAGIIWNDVGLSVKWHTDDPILSDKDLSLPSLASFQTPFI